MSTLPIESRYKFMQSLNEFGQDNLEKNVELMDLTYNPDGAVLGRSNEIWS